MFYKKIQQNLEKYSLFQNLENKTILVSITFHLFTTTRCQLLQYLYHQSIIGYFLLSVIDHKVDTYYLHRLIYHQSPITISH